MDSIVSSEFQDRQEDIEKIIELARFLEGCDKIYGSTDSDSDNSSFIIDDNILNIMKSLIQMICYNQIESTMRGCLEGVYDEIEDNHLGYEDLQPHIQKIILSGLLKNYESGDDLHKKIGSNINQRSPKSSLKIKKVFNGNVSKDTINEIKKKYKITITAPADTRDGIEITTLKDARNDLAHGNKTFSNHGRDYTLDNVISTSERTSSYLREVINSFDSYIEEESYLKSNNS